MRSSLLPFLFPLTAFAAAPPSAPAPGEAGTVETIHNYPSEHVARRDVAIWLPPGYATDKDAHYPVLYVQDGQNAFGPATASGQVDWGVDEAMTRLIQARHVRPAIVVAISSTFLRTLEYMPQKALLGKNLKDWAAKIPGGAKELPVSDAYLRFLVRELKPEMDRRYRTRSGPADTFMLGSNLGALVSLYALCEYPQVFGAVACLSSHWPAADGATLDYARRALPQAGQHRLYFDYGKTGLETDYERYQKRLDELLRARGYGKGRARDWVTRKFAGAGHDEAAWRARLAEPLRFLLGQ